MILPSFHYVPPSIKLKPEIRVKKEDQQKKRKSKANFGTPGVKGLEKWNFERIFKQKLRNEKSLLKKCQL